MFLYFILGVTALTATVQNIFKQKFNEKCRVSSAYFFSAMTAAVAMLFFIVINLFYNKDWYYNAGLLLPSAAFGISYATASVFSVLAIFCGPLAKTSLLISCSLLIPSFYGIIVQGTPITPTLVIGTLLLVVTLFLVNSEKKDAPEEKKITLKWIIFALLAFIGNGMCSTVQTAKQDFYGNDGNNVFMIVALAIVVTLLTVAAFCFKNERPYVKVSAQKGWFLAFLCGAANGLTNFFVMLLNANKFPASVLFPVVSGGGLLMIFLWSVLIKKEKFTVPQYVGYALGVVSLVLLNI